MENQRHGEERAALLARARRVVAALSAQRELSPAAVGVALLRLRAALALGTFSHQQLRERALASLVEEVDALMPWEEAERSILLSAEWPTLDVVWMRSAEVIKRDAVLTPASLREALGDLVAPSAFAQWEEWERDARRLIAAQGGEDA